MPFIKHCSNVLVAVAGRRRQCACMYIHAYACARVCVCVCEQWKNLKKNIFWKPFDDVVAANCLIPFIVVVTGGCPCLKWLGLFFSSFFFCKIFCKSAMHELRLLNALPLSHARCCCCCVLALSRALSLVVCACVCVFVRVSAGSQLLRSLFVSLSLADTLALASRSRQICSFCPIFLVAKRKFNIFLLCGVQFSL